MGQGARGGMAVATIIALPAASDSQRKREGEQRVSHHWLIVKRFSSNIPEAPSSLHAA